MDKDKLQDCMQQAHYADDFMDLKVAVINFMNLVYDELYPPLNWNRPIYVRDDVDLKELCYYFEELDDRFINKSEFGECITVMKDTREVYEYGYDGTVLSWWEQGKLRQ
jgi:hypothetical protein